ncbi:phosphotransferase [Corynebacterium aquilae]|uniref:Aminoglycoside phosphotransferase domain-containing protein n=1 Tax=Corynebacterium aquilae DSM 44791 TaxID=1431546 RepID=A0A1L7CH72_9CORY|nr:phosphotransferase [Corynebacterium aquilae]APT85211.1 hypothetical protein CAQU_09150 [Corynebacterium aquilae DSM 44791]
MGDFCCPDSVLAGLADTLGAARFVPGDAEQVGSVEVLACQCFLSEAQAHDFGGSSSVWWVVAGCAAGRFQLFVDASGKEVSTTPAVVAALARGVVPGSWRVVDHAHKPCSADVLWGGREVSGRALSAEQSNTTLVFVDAVASRQVAVKLQRGLWAAADHVAVEITALTVLSAAGNAPVAPLVGFATAEISDGAGGCEEVVVAVATGFVAGAVDAFAVVSGQLDVGADVATVAFRLGEATATMHAELLAGCGGSVVKGAQWAAQLAARRQALGDGEGMLGGFVTVAARHSERVCAHKVVGRKVPVQKVHGDFHLGQVLLSDCAGADPRVTILDFEGEPAREMAQRLLPLPREADVAGMLRSFDYAAAVATGMDATAAGELSGRWGRQFLRGYEQLLPVDPVVLSLLVVDKALYELRYELAHRPQWVDIPRAKLVEILGQPEN